MTPVLAGDGERPCSGTACRAAVAQEQRGIGRELVRIAVEAAKRKGSEAIILVGDPPYYGPLGFEKVAYGARTFPVPLDPGRVLVVPIAEDTHARLKGTIAWRR